MPRKPRPTLRAAVEWLAANDETGGMTPEERAGLVTTLVVADLFGVEPLALGERIERRRRELYPDD